MYKSISITVPPGTQSDSPLETSVKLCDGTIKAIHIRPAVGPQWELYTKIEYRETPLVPSEDAEWIPLERDIISAYPNWRRWDGTYYIVILSCSPAARFTHNYIVDIEVEEGMTMVEAIMDLITRGI
jgi:hypothetical protein